MKLDRPARRSSPGVPADLSAKFDIQVKQNEQR
jgi:hypothetical protein